MKRLAAGTTAFLAVLAMVVGGCSSGNPMPMSAYEGYMADACDGLRTMADAYEAEDREAFDEGYRDVMNLHPAADEAGDDKALQREVLLLHDAQRVLHIAAYEPAEENDGASVWRGLELSDPDRARIQRGIDACKQY